MVLGCAFMVFSGVIILVYLREVGFALSLSLSLFLLLCGGGWGVCVCVWLEGGVGVGGASFSGGVLGAFLLRGAGWDFSAC